MSSARRDEGVYANRASVGWRRCCEFGGNTTTFRLLFPARTAVDAVQMSRMLDVLEEFLTLHGHAYVRLDGTTGVEKRQRLMDRCAGT